MSVWDASKWDLRCKSNCEAMHKAFNEILRYILIRFFKTLKAISWKNYLAKFFTLLPYIIGVNIKHIEQ